MNVGDVEWHVGWSVLTDYNYSQRHGRNQLEKRGKIFESFFSHHIHVDLQIIIIFFYEMSQLKDFRH